MSTRRTVSGTCRTRRGSGGSSPPRAGRPPLWGPWPGAGVGIGVSQEQRAPDRDTHVFRTSPRAGRPSEVSPYTRRHTSPGGLEVGRTGRRRGMRETMEGTDGNPSARELGRKTLFRFRTLEKRVVPYFAETYGVCTTARKPPAPHRIPGLPPRDTHGFSPASGT